MHRWRMGEGEGGRERGRARPGSVCVVRSRSVLCLPCMEKQESVGQEAWEAGAIAMIEIQPQSGGSVNCSLLIYYLFFLKKRSKNWSPPLCFCSNCCTSCRRKIRDLQRLSRPHDVRCQSARLAGRCQRGCSARPAHE